MQTTLNEIKKHNPNELIYQKLLNNSKAEDEPIDFMTILEAVGIESAIWCLRTQDYKEYCLFLADVAELILYLFEIVYSDDKAPRQVIKAVRDWYNGDITQEQLNAYAAAAESSADYAGGNNITYAANTYACVYTLAAYAARAASNVANPDNPAVNVVSVHGDVAAAVAGGDAYTYRKAVESNWKAIYSLFTKHFGGAERANNYKWYIKKQRR